MNIGFYGHSICSWSGTKFGYKSFIDQIAEKYSANIVNIGSLQGSEERILFELKKTKKLDVAFIFHSYPKFVFIPKCDRDISIKSVPENKAKQFWRPFNEGLGVEGEGNPTEPSQEEFEKYFQDYGNFKDVFKTSEEYIIAMKSYKSYFYHPDLVTNRYQSAAVLIDQYLIGNNIKAYHSIDKRFYPNWMDFKSGPVEHELAELRDVESTIRLPNNINPEQNDYIFETLDKWMQSINAASSKEAIR